MTDRMQQTNVISVERETDQHQPMDAHSTDVMNIFRQAFAGNADAWTTLYIHYTPLVRHWIGAQYRIDSEEVVQETWLNFARYAPSRPSLVEGDSPGQVLAYLRTCVKTALISQYRREKWYQMATLDDTDPALSLATLDYTMAERLTIWERVMQIVTSDDERMILQLRFVCGMKPKVIAAVYPERFPDVRSVYVLVSRLVKRLREDPILQGLRSTL